MDTRFHNLGFAAKPTLKEFNNLDNIFQIRAAGGSYFAETTLCLDSSGSPISSVSASKGIKRKWKLIDDSVGQQPESLLCLRLGHSTSSSDSKGSSATACTSISSAKEIEESSSIDLDLDFSLHLGSDKTHSLEKTTNPSSKAVDVWPKVGLELSLSSGTAESDITSIQLSSTPPQNVINQMPVAVSGAFCTEDGSISSSLRTGSLYNPLQTADNMQTSYFLNIPVTEIRPAATTPDPSTSIIATPKSSVTCTSGITQQQSQRSTSTKQCQFNGCVKGARGASGLCIAHGGGRRCQRPGCHKGAEGRTAFCKAHGGGRRCEFLGCTKSAEGRTDLCIAHGGGRRCSHEGCSRAARGKSGLCIRHGGGKRCQTDNCTKSAEGLSGLCISHGGGRRCQYPECTKGAQGSTMFCKAHGGGKRCTFEGCTKGAEGSTPFCKGHGGGKRCSFQGGGICPKSVHGGTLYCVAHGGGKRCAVPECTKSARGRTDFCVRHGGGKRCRSEGCGKSAQGSTDFCKAHGGGKRCSWGQPGSEFGIGKNPCKSFVRGKTGLCASHGALVQDKRVHGGATVGAAVQDSEPSNEKMKQVIIAVDMNAADITKMESSVITSFSSSGWKNVGIQQPGIPVGRSTSSNTVTVPEGRVHGGRLMAMMVGNSAISFSSSSDVISPSEQEKSWFC